MEISQKEKVQHSLAIILKNANETSKNSKKNEKRN